jgi:hypothetical protein
VFVINIIGIIGRNVDILGFGLPDFGWHINYYQTTMPGTTSSLYTDNLAHGLGKRGGLVTCHMHGPDWHQAACDMGASAIGRWSNGGYGLKGGVVE